MLQDTQESLVTPTVPIAIVTATSVTMLLLSAFTYS